MSRIAMTQEIEKEAAACRRAFIHSKVGDFVLHCHHKILSETLIEPAENRIRFILDEKPANEQPLRLRLFRPVSRAAFRRLGRKYPTIKQAYAAWQQASAARQQAYAARQQAYAAWQQAYAAWEQARAAWEQARAAWEQARAALGILIHPHVCKNCPWDGKTIFSKEQA